MKKSINTVALIGLGAIGGYLANYLQKAVGYENLRIIADGSRKTKIEKDGLLVNGNPVFFRVVTPKEIMEPADLVVIITKFNALPQAILDIKNQIGENTIIMSPLNGIESEDLVAKEYGYEKLLYSFARVSVNMIGNQLTFDPSFAFMEFGERLNYEISERVTIVSDLFEKAGIKYKIPEDMILAIWGKFMCNVSENRVTALLHIPFGAFHENVHANYVREMAMREVVQIANAKGIALSEEDILQHRERLKKIRYEGKPSTLQDIEAGRKTEVDMFSGTIIRLGLETGIPTPVNEFLFHAIKVLEDVNDGIIRI